MTDNKLNHHDPNDPLAALLQKHWHPPSAPNDQAQSLAQVQARLLAQVQALPMQEAGNARSNFWRWLAPSTALAAALAGWLIVASPEFLNRHQGQLSPDDPLLQASISETVLGPPYREDL
jgi:anti-sigma-K factor RskA